MKKLLLLLCSCSCLLLSAQVDTVGKNLSFKRKKFTYKEKGYAGRVALNANPLMLIYQDYNLQIANGYKFNQYAQLYGTVGVETYFWFLFGERFEVDSVVVTKGRDADPLRIILPLGVQLRGEVGKRKVKFYYELLNTINIPLNYSYRIEKSIFDYTTKIEAKYKSSRFSHTVGTSFGMAAFTKSRFNFSTGLNCNFILEHTKNISQTSESSSTQYTELFPFLGLQFGFGW